MTAPPAGCTAPRDSKLVILRIADDADGGAGGVSASDACLSSLHLLPGFRSSEHCPQPGGCRPFPRSEGSIERIRILVAEQKCHFRDSHLRPIEILVRQFLPRLKKQLPESCAVIDDSTLQG